MKTKLTVLSWTKNGNEISLVKNLKRISIFFFALFLFLASCKKAGDPTLASPCSSGIDIRTINDNSISQNVKDKIFKPVTPAKSSWNYISKSSPGYNKTGKTLIIPVEFPSLPHNTSISTSTINDAFFSFGGFGNDNVRAYFEKNSYGQFTLTDAGIPSWVSLNNDTAYYANGMPGRDWTRNQQLSKDICQAAFVNWSALDLNHDHIITGNEVQIVFLYCDGGLGASRWASFPINTSSGTYTISINLFCYLSCKSNSAPDKATDPIAYNYVTIRHELMHCFFGLPDRYTSFCGTGYTGEYDPMSACRPRWISMNIVDKIKLGWLTPKILSFDNTAHIQQCYSFPNSELSQAALVLYTERYPDECWIIENRCNNCSMVSNFDSGLPESGLAVWWLDLKTENVVLIDASKPAQKPNLYTSPISGALYALNAKSPDEFNLLLPADGFLAFAFRKVSASGSVMYAEF